MISVIIPMYNTALYIERCIKSVMNQSYKDLEIIIVDDGSTDNSIEICEKLQKQDCRILIISQDNAGASVARNTGINASKGNYIMFVDSDDYIAPELTEELLRSLSDTHADAVISQIPGDKQVSATSRLMDWHEVLLYMLRDQALWSPYGKLFKTERIGELRFAKPTISEDYRFMTDFVLARPIVFYRCQSFYYRTARFGSLSRSKFSARSFDELDNVFAVFQAVCSSVPEYRSYALRNFAETLLKLSLNSSPIHSSPEREEQLSSLVRRYYYEIFWSKTIPFKQKFLLSTCLSGVSRRLTRYVRTSFKIQFS